MRLVRVKFMKTLMASGNTYGDTYYSNNMNLFIIGFLTI